MIMFSIVIKMIFNYLKLYFSFNSGKSTLDYITITTLLCIQIITIYINIFIYIKIYILMYL